MKKRLGALALLVSVGLPVSADASLQKLTNLFVFGDSLSDGGNSGLASKAVTGGTVVFPPPPYYNGQYSNGPVAVEYLWQMYNPGDTSFTPSLVGGTNYAIGGATTGVENYNSVNPLADPLQPVYEGLGTAWQLGRFAAQHPVFDPATSLFVVWLFPNDVFYADATRTLPGTVPGSPGGANLIANGIANIAATIQTLAAAGAQHFLVPNMPDLGKTPEFLGDTTMTNLSVAFNAALEFTLNGLDRLLPAEIVRFDTFATLNSVLANPGAYGFDLK